MAASEALAALAVVGAGVAVLGGGGLYMVRRPGAFVDTDHAVGSSVQVTVDAIHDRWGRRAAERFVQLVGAFLVLGAAGGVAAIVSF